MIFLWRWDYVIKAKVFYIGYFTCLPIVFVSNICQKHDQFPFFAALWSNIFYWSNFGAAHNLSSLCSTSRPRHAGCFKNTGFKDKNTILHVCVPQIHKIYSIHSFYLRLSARLQYCAIDMCPFWCPRCSWCMHTVYDKHTEAWTQWPTVFRHFQMHFLECKFRNLQLNFTEYICKCLNENTTNSCLGYYITIIISWIPHK